jgi:hypothetical protein
MSAPSGKISAGFLQVLQHTGFINLQPHKKQVLGIVYMLLHANDIELLLGQQARYGCNKSYTVGALYNNYHPV